jgi:hypothetical protein
VANFHGDVQVLCGGARWFALAFGGLVSAVVGCSLRNVKMAIAKDDVFSAVLLKSSLPDVRPVSLRRFSVLHNISK